MTPESKVKAAIFKYLTRRGIFHWNNPTGTVRVAPGRWISFGAKGSPDIIGVLPDGRFFGVEVKSTHGRLAPEQRDFLNRITALGGLAVVARLPRRCGRCA